MATKMSYMSQRYRPADFILLAFFTALVMVISCNYDTHDDNKEEKLIRQQSNDQTGVKEHDGSFLIQTALFNLKMQALASIGTQHAVSQEVKTLAADIATQHSKMMASLGPLAKEENVSLPDVLDETNKLELNNVIQGKDEDFDNRFCDYVMREHNYILEHLARFAEKPQGPDVQGFARDYTAVVKGILDEAEKCAVKIKT